MVHIGLEKKSIKLEDQLNRRMNKKGNLLGEYTLKIIISAMALLLLLYLLFVLYSTFTDKQSFARAEATLESLNEKMADARENQTGSESIPLLEPNGWRLISFAPSLSAADKPDKCQKNCICLCEDEDTAWKLWWAKDQIEKCNIRGVCKNYDAGINDLKIELRKDVEVKFQGGNYVITEK